MKRNFQILIYPIICFDRNHFSRPGKNKTAIATSASVLTTFGETCLTMASTPGNSGKTRYVK